MFAKNSNLMKKFHYSTLKNFAKHSNIIIVGRGTGGVATAKQLERKGINKNDITILSSVNSYQIPYGVLSFDKYNRFEKIIEKPIFKNNINIGIYIIRPNVLHLIKENKHLNFTDLVKNAKKNKLQIGIFKIQKINWKDIGEWDKYNNFLKNSK